MKKKIVIALLALFAVSNLTVGCGANKKEEATTAEQTTTEAGYDSIKYNSSSSSLTAGREKMPVTDETLQIVADRLNGEHELDDEIDFSDITLDEAEVSAFETLMDFLDTTAFEYDKNTMKVKFIGKSEYKIGYDEEKIHMEVSKYELVTN